MGRPIGTSGGLIPRLSDPLSVISGGSPSHVYSIPVFTNAASVYSFNISGLPPIFGQTAPSVAVIDYFNPATGRITRDYQFFGGGAGENRLNILSGSPDGAQVAGEIRISVYGMPSPSPSNVAFGLFGPFASVFAQGDARTNSLSAHTGYLVSEAGVTSYDLSQGPINKVGTVSFNRPTGTADWTPVPTTLPQAFIDKFLQIIGIDVRARCFVAGTQITMADGSTKPIEEVDEGDWVMSFDPHAENGLGAHVPGKVTQTFQNVTRVLIDVCGLRITPGHECLSDNGDWMSIADILRKDRAIVRDIDGKGVAVRARTNQTLGTDEDIVFPTFFYDPQTGPCAPSADSRCVRKMQDGCFKARDVAVH